MDSPGRPWRDCTIAAAWRALGDPRGAADIERAHEEAIWLGPIGGLGADEQRTLYGRYMYAPDEVARAPDPDEAEQRWAILSWGVAAGAFVAQRQRSDSRGMEAVEAEARWDDRYGRPAEVTTRATLRRYVPR